MKLSLFSIFILEGPKLSCIDSRGCQVQPHRNFTEVSCTVQMREGLNLIHNHGKATLKKGSVLGSLESVKTAV